MTAARVKLVLAVVVLAFCSTAPLMSNSAARDPETPGVAEPTADAIPQVGPSGSPISGSIRIDNFGWRPGDRKIGVLKDRERVVVEVRRISDHAQVWTGVSSALRTDEDSGDRYSTIDLSTFQQPGAYYLFLPADNVRSYDFAIDPHVYDVVGAAAAKSYYFQRCNHAHTLPFASDALPGYPGIGGRWVDELCHPGDFATPAGPGSPDHGQLDLHGGWHDAGDYQKTLWDRGVDAMLWAYEVRPGAWRDGQLDIPESGNDVPDLLDEIAWELDFYLRMQRPDGHFMTSVKGRQGRVSSPPSASDERRVYFDSTSPADDGWSGGGVTIDDATANAVLALAHAAIVFREAGQAERAQSYAAAALAGFRWLDATGAAARASRAPKGSTVLAAAAAVHRLDPANTSARGVVEAFDWEAWRQSLGSATPAEHLVAETAWHCLADPATDERLRATIRRGLNTLVERTLDQAGDYGGLYGDANNGWDWSWGSNRTQSVYGAILLMAAHFGATGGRSRAEVEEHGRRYFHYLLGLNPLNMVYLTNMAAYGGEHSSFQIYHGWFSHDGGRDRGNADYNGKPKSVFEPLYPYDPDDRQVSRFGPAPGLMPGGPNWYYSGSYAIANRHNPAYAYRDWSVGCDWDGARCRSASWEITEPAVGYQGWFLLLASFMMSDGS
jgi:Glycosyl hydrolase family 9./N-terminal ig-like domain of cellulase.